MSPLEGKYIRAPEYDAMFDVTSNWLNNSQPGLAYRYMLLAPKGAAQVAKTILSPITHVRNFLSATAFAAANGAILPSLTDIQTLAPKTLGGKGALGEAYRMTAGRVFGTLPEEQDSQYSHLRGQPYGKQCARSIPEFSELAQIDPNGIFKYERSHQSGELLCGDMGND